MTDQASSGWAEVRWRDAAYHLRVPDAETDYIQGRVLKEGAPYEEELLAEFARRLRPGDLALDVGANVGNHTLFMACVLGCRVEAFEPDEHLTQAIDESAERNGVQQLVQIHRVAVGASHGKGVLVCDDPSNLGGQRVAPEGDHGPSVEVVTLDSVTFDAPVRLVKIDVEGAEVDVLRGASALLQQDRPLVYVECLNEADFELVESTLDDHDYIWIGVWNASPTHCFVHLEQLSEIEGLRSRLREVALAHYALLEQSRSDRQRLDQANMQYRSLAQAVSGPGESRAGDMQVMLSTAEGTRLQLEQLTKQLASTQSELARRLDTSHARATWAVRDLGLQLVEAREAAADLRRDLAAERERAETLNRQLTREVAEQARLRSTLDERLVALEKAEGRCASNERLAADWKLQASELERAGAEAQNRLRAQIDVADELRVKVASLVARHERVRSDLKVVRRHIEAQEEEARRLNAAEVKAREDLSVERSRHSDLETALREEVTLERSRHNNIERALREELHEEASRHGDIEAALREELHEEASRHCVTQAERDSYRRTLVGLRNSGTYILGAALRDARSPRGLFRLIPEMRRAYRAAKESRR
ncbi:FkbM family methyltransferase [Terrabacter sp. MAHUQ-38]|uniref:FkbM family methyltransferase n=1 Tax=unclassified Terrabacter TaxID=2630222 RepID=UPI00165D5AA5|nr:FkbM family methyltransferase [Terrabacter sp. MAHUQ-38]MBC9821934.1 FkbM family methyltransferase [Terrabacter sp. MAHUQ-38]